MNYELYYWPGIQGRGEFVRLALEEGGADYRDIALLPEEQGGGVPALLKFLDGPDVARPPFAPPFLKAGRRLIGQTANILLFLGPRLGLAPRDADGRLWTHQLQLTLADFVLEIHDTHHPIGGGLYYEQQKAEAKRRSREFLAQRLPKFLGYFERVIERAERQMAGRQAAELCRPVDGPGGRRLALRVSAGEQKGAARLPAAARAARGGVCAPAHQALCRVGAATGI